MQNIAHVNSLLYNHLLTHMLLLTRTQLYKVNICQGSNTSDCSLTTLTNLSFQINKYNKIRTIAPSVPSPQVVISASDSPLCLSHL